MPFRKLEEPARWLPQICTHPEHNPPGLICLEPGTYEYACPSCGSTQLVVVPGITWGVGASTCVAGCAGAIDSFGSL